MKTLHQCKNQATFVLIDGYAPDDYTLSCDCHLENMKSDTFIKSEKYIGNEKCCFMAEFDRDELRIQFEKDIGIEKLTGNYWKSNVGTLQEYIEWLEMKILIKSK